MRKSILILLLTCLPFLYLASCGGGDGNGGEEFTVFDITISVLEVESKNGPTDCPESANLKLSLLINGNTISGFAELIGFGNIGDSTPISGIIEGNNISLDSFNVTVLGDDSSFFPEPEPCCVLNFGFKTFEGFMLDNDGDGVFDRIEGSLAGSISLLIETHLLCYNSEFTGKFSGIARMPEGCVSSAEAPTLECPAEGFINMCDAFADFFCFGWCEPLDDGGICVDFAFHASQCEIIDCLNVSCPGIGLVNLEGLEDYGSFQVIIGPHTVPCF